MEGRRQGSSFVGLVVLVVDHVDDHSRKLGSFVRAPNKFIRSVEAAARLASNPLSKGSLKGAEHTVQREEGLYVGR